MEKDDLMSGCIVKFRDGTYGVVCKPIFSSGAICCDNGLEYFHCYTEDLIHKSNSKYDIVEVIMFEDLTSMGDMILQFTNKYTSSVFKWERKEVKKVIPIKEALSKLEEFYGCPIKLEDGE